MNSKLSDVAIGRKRRDPRAAAFIQHSPHPIVGADGITWRWSRQSRSRTSGFTKPGVIASQMA